MKCNAPIRMLLVITFCAVAGAAYAESINVKDTGAIGDGRMLDTVAVQKAIDTCTTGGGGTVTLPAGSYLVGTILLKDNVTLHLDEGATLLGTADLSQYKN